MKNEKILIDGLEYCNWNRELFEKSIMTSYKFGTYKSTGLYYQASYELDFLNKYYKTMRKKSLSLNQFGRRFFFLPLKYIFSTYINLVSKLPRLCYKMSGSC